jgi:hypothetical protein
MVQYRGRQISGRKPWRLAALCVPKPLLEPTLNKSNNNNNDDNNNNNKPIEHSIYRNSNANVTLRPQCSFHLMDEIKWILKIKYSFSVVFTVGGRQNKTVKVFLYFDG